MMDYESIAVGRLAGQFGDSTRLKAFISAMVAPLSVAEADVDALLADRWIDTAYGAQLDGCGEIVIEPRMGRDDDEYRAALRFRVFVNLSKGTPLDIIYALRFLTQPSDAQYIEQYPATVLLYSDGIRVSDGIVESMQDLLPAGVSDVPVAVSYGYPPLRTSIEPPPGELWVGDAETIDVNGSDLQVTTSTPILSGGFGGAVPADLQVGDGLSLDVGLGELALYDPNHLVPLGDTHLTGVYQ